MARPKKVQVTATSTDVEVEMGTSTDVAVEVPAFVFHLSEKEVMDANGNVCLEWTDAQGCTFKQLKP